MGKKVQVDVTAIGRLGGLATAKKRTAAQRRAAAQLAIKKRWEKYYREHPEKLAAKRQKAKKSKVA